MNTLSRTITARFFPNSDSYNAFRQHWSVLINSERRHELSAVHHLLYLAFSGKDWRKAFTLPTNQRKLENGAFVGWAMFRALQLMHNKFADSELIAPFDGFVTPQMLEELRNIFPLINPYGFKVEQFSTGTFPFEAYKDEMFSIIKTERKAHE
jgi:hypothetical protein